MQLIYNEHIRYKREIVQALKELKPPTRGDFSFKRFNALLRSIKPLPGHGYSCQAVDDEGSLLGCMIAMTERRIWFDRAQCFLVLLISNRSDIVPKLMRDFVEWVNKSPAIAVVRIATETIIDPKLLRITRRFPLKQAIWM